MIITETLQELSTCWDRESSLSLDILERRFTRFERFRWRCYAQFVSKETMLRYMWEERERLTEVMQQERLDRAFSQDSNKGHLDRSVSSSSPSESVSSAMKSEQSYSELKEGGAKRVDFRFYNEERVVSASWEEGKTKAEMKSLLAKVEKDRMRQFCQLLRDHFFDKEVVVVAGHGQWLQLFLQTLLADNDGVITGLASHHQISERLMASIGGAKQDPASEDLRRSLPGDEFDLDSLERAVTPGGSKLSTCGLLKMKLTCDVEGKFSLGPSFVLLDGGFSYG